jgi:ATP-dependent Lon protease
MDFLHLVHDLIPEGDEAEVHLITQPNADYSLDQEESLSKVVDAFTGSKIAFSWEFDDNPNFHARSITTDTGWKISTDRGLDIFQKYKTGNFSLEQAIQDARLTRGTEITYIKT